MITIKDVETWLKGKSVPYEVMVDSATAIWVSLPCLRGGL